MALGRPIINVPRGANISLRSLAAALDAANQRIEAIEQAIAAMPEQNVSILANTLFKSGNGVVVKKNNVLTTRKVVSNSGATITNGDGQKGDIIVNVP